MKRIKQFWKSLDSLDDRIFFLTVIVSVFVGIAVTITNQLQGLSPQTKAASFGVTGIMILLFYLGLKFPARRGLLRICLVLVLNMIIFPISFLYSGGIRSGMILFFLIGLFLVPVLTRGKTSIILFLLSVSVMLVIVDFAQYAPETVVPVTLEAHYLDVKVTLLISGIGLYAITFLILGAYNQERIRNEKLMLSLRNLSVKDPLSGLYNRRELYRRLEIMYGDEEKAVRKDTLVLENHYIAMLDIDDFKSINDTYGHAAGDLVLKKISDVLKETADSAEGEFAARYGGEEFVVVLKADSMNAAFQRIDAARQTIASLTWEEGFPKQVTISGGIVSCMDDADLSAGMRKADERLYHAKAAGKNRIVRSGS